jgi:ParB family chromosome partitioning protein
MMTRRALGRGLEALIPPRAATVEASASAPVNEPSSSGPLHVDVERIRPNPRQPRRRFDTEKLRELAESVRENGILQPLLVNPSHDGYELVAGERRWRAARMVGLRRVPVVVRAVDGRESLKLSILENVQREDLNPIEEAHGYRQLIDEFGMTQEEIGARLGKSRSAIANTLRLLQLAPEVQARIQTGELTAGHARALLGAATLEEQIELASLVREGGMTVRQAEEMTQSRRRGAALDNGKTARQPALDELAQRLEARLGTRVRIQARKSDGSAGKIEIDYYSATDLERIFETVGVSYLL